MLYFGRCLMWRNGGFWSEKLQRYGTDSRKSGPLTLTVRQGHILHPAGQLLEQKTPLTPICTISCTDGLMGLPHSLKLSPRLSYKSPHFSAHYCPGWTLKHFKYKDMSYKSSVFISMKHTHAQTIIKILSSFTYFYFWKNQDIWTTWTNSLHGRKYIHFLSLKHASKYLILCSTEKRFGMT